MLKMELPQESLEEAVRDYLAKLGLNLPVTAVEFTAQRSNGNKILTELTLGGITEAVVDTVAPASTAPAGKKDNVAKIEPQSETATEAPAEEASAEEEAPGEESDAGQEDVPAGKSLFG